MLARFSGRFLSPKYGFILGIYILAYVCILFIPTQKYIFSADLIQFLTLHSFMELFSIIVSILAFAVTWEAEKKLVNPIVIGVTFLAIGFIDFAHMLSYPGMPEFVTPASANKSMYFWLCARFLVASCVLFMAVSPLALLRANYYRYIILAVSLLVVILVYYVGFNYLNLIPSMFIEGHGLAPFTIYSEGFIIAILLCALAAFLMRSGILEKSYDLENIFMAVITMIMGETFFMNYVDDSKLYSFAGHVFKVISYYYFYKALFRESLLKPYSLLNKKNRELQEAQLLVDAAELAKRQFLSNMSHEIRTPMNTIVGMTDLLGETRLNDEQIQYVRFIKESGNRLLVMLTDILELSDVEIGFAEWSREEFDFRVFIVRLERTFLDLATKKKIRMELKIAPDVPRLVVGDSKKLNRIFMNIVGNAIKFTDVGSVKVDIAVKAHSKSGIILIIQVQDTGVGIPADRIETLFQEFSQIDCSFTRKHRGVGLGLALSKTLINGLGGDIWVDSEINKGSTFCFTIAFGLKENEILYGYS